MSIHFVCPLGHKLKVPDDRAGKNGRCPVCQQQLIVPQLSPTPSVLTAEADNETALELVSPPSLPLSMAGDRIAPPPIPSLAAITTVAAPPPLPSRERPKAGLTEAATRQTDVDVAKRSLRWLTWQQPDRLAGYAVYRPNPRQLEIAYWLACLLPFVVAFCAAPALPHMQFRGAPIWAQTMLCGAALQLGYAAWLALLPDWSTIRVGMYLFTATAAAYLIALLVACYLPDSQLSAVGLAGMRWPAAAWCGLVSAAASLAGAACGWVGQRWRT
jgi:hypothetical protein